MKKQKEEINYTEEERQLINKAIKRHNRLKGSKYIRPSFSVIGLSYNDSYKKPKAIEEIEQSAK